MVLGACKSTHWRSFLVLGFSRDRANGLRVRKWLSTPLTLEEFIPPDKVESQEIASRHRIFLPAGFLPVANLLTRCGGRFGSARALRYPLFYSDLASVEIRRGFCKRQEPLSKKNKNKIQSVTNSCLPRPLWRFLPFTEAWVNLDFYPVLLAWCLRGSSQAPSL